MADRYCRQCITCFKCQICNRRCVCQYAGKKELAPWLKYFIATEPADFWSKVTCPVLVLNGEKDKQVYPDDNVPAIQKALQSANNKKVTVNILPGLNHLFQHCNECSASVAEYAKIDETFSPEVLAIMNNWLHTQIVK